MMNTIHWNKTKLLMGDVGDVEVFIWSWNFNITDRLEKDILDSISIIQEKSRIADAESIFKYLSSTGATNIIIEVVKQRNCTTGSKI